MTSIKRHTMLRAAIVLAQAWLLCVPDAGADTIPAASPSYDDVSAAVASAAPGDTVTVPAGSATWTSQLTVTRGITLMGAGADRTTITADVGGEAYAVAYEPDDPSLDEAFRLTGFGFDLGFSSNGLLLSNADVLHPLTKIRIDHNSFTSCMAGFWVIDGAVYGVADSNTFNGQVHMDNLGEQDDSWNNLTFTCGTAQNFYYEDNTFDTDYTIATGGHGGRYAYRYNTFNLTDDLYPMFDSHGNQTSGVYATMGIEIYGNLINAGEFTADLCDRRGGKALIFYNWYVGTGTAFGQSREEFSDAISPPAESPIDGTPQHISDSYYWNNRENAELVTWPLTQNCCATTADELSMDCPAAACSPEEGIQENREWWNHREPFDGTVGMGCGTLASRPATCTPGTGYWATDQSCSDLSGLVGASPATPISGTLFKCTAADTWTEACTPFAYPHPLRLRPCSELGGACCSAGQTCEGGAFDSGSDCASLCCVGGTCEGTPDPAEPDGAETVEEAAEDGGPDVAPDADAPPDVDGGDGGEEGGGEEGCGCAVAR